jgi:hypothetical protein
MRSYLIARNLIAAVSGVILIGLAVSGAAYAVNSAVFRYSAEQTGYLVIPAAAFVPNNPSMVYNNSGAFLDSTGIAEFFASVHLPHGAKITQVAIWYSRDGVGPTGFVFRRVLLTDRSTSNVALLSTPGTGGQYTMTALNITDPSVQIVNNARYAYFLELSISDQEVFYSARIKYTYKTAGD